MATTTSSCGFAVLNVALSFCAWPERRLRSTKSSMRLASSRVAHKLASDECSPKSSVKSASPAKSLNITKSPRGSGSTLGPATVPKTAPTLVTTY